MKVTCLQIAILYTSLLLSAGSAFGQCGETASDSCFAPRELSGWPGAQEIVMGVEAATADQAPSCGFNVGHTTWFRITPVLNGLLTFSTCHPLTNYDTVVAAYSGGECEILTPIDCVDDNLDASCDNGCAGRGSILSFDATAGTTYWFQVGSYNNNSAGCGLCLGVLVSLGGQCGENPSDFCQIPRSLSGSPGVHYVQMDLTTATADVAMTCSGNTGHTAWFEVTPEVNGTATFTTCTPDTTFDTVVQVWQPGDEACQVLANVACNDDTFIPECEETCSGRASMVTFDVDADERYLIQVGSYNNNSGGCPLCLGGQLTIESEADECDTCFAVNEGTFEGSTEDNSGASGDDSSCAFNDTIDEWYCYTAECTGAATATLCGSAYDTTLALFEACGDAEIVCNDDGDCDGVAGNELQSTVEWPVVAGNTYPLRISGYNGVVGPYSLTISCESPPINDCNRNDVADEVDLETATSLDCNQNGQPDECDIQDGVVPDCNTNGVPDACDIANEFSRDENTNGIPDECDGQPIASVRINEVLINPAPGSHQWVELYVGEDAVVAGLQIRNSAGDAYEIPGQMPLPLPGPSVVVHFDGLGAGADDYDLSDGVAHLHTPPGMVNVFDTVEDSVTVCASGGGGECELRSFVAYGGPAPQNVVAGASQSILWDASWWVTRHTGSGAEIEGAVPGARRSIGRAAGLAGDHPGEWTTYEGEDISPGRTNVVPRSYWATVDSGEVLSTDGFALGWRGDGPATHRFQLDDDPAFGSPLVNDVLAQPYYNSDAIPPGDYWWRSRPHDVNGRTGQWSSPRSVSIIGGAPNTAAGIQQNVLNMSWLRQRKDTNLLCHDGCREGPATMVGGQGRWDGIHPDGIYRHGRNNCVRACIAMIVTNYGGSLSQDRISYEYFERNGNPLKNWGGVGDPHKDLGHDMTTIICGANSTGAQLFHWALGVSQSDVGYAQGAPTFANVQSWIDAGRPIMRAHSTGPSLAHMTVIAGYRVLPGNVQQLRLFDPWSGPTWVNFATLPFICHYVAPANAPSVVSDEASIWNDSDNDGVMDFDEQVRFNTSSSVADTDADFVPDKPDMREYLFNNIGQYNLRSVDFDEDFIRKELDPDNDGDGALDGCEDGNANGRYEAAIGESNNFSEVSCGGMCSESFEPNETELGAYGITPGNFSSSITELDYDYYALNPTDVVDLQLSVTYQVRPQPGHRIEVEFDGNNATESPSGTFNLSRNGLIPGRHVLGVFGEQSSTHNCYDVDYSTSPATIVPDRFDDQTPPGEPRNDALTNAAQIGGTLQDRPYPMGNIEFDLNHDVLSDIDFFTVQLPPAVDPSNGNEECCASPLGANENQGEFRILVYPDGYRPFDITVYNNNGTVHSSTSGLVHRIDCPHGDFPDGQVRFSIRDSAGRNFYYFQVGYSRCYTRIYPPWTLDFDPPRFRYVLPIFPDVLRLVFPLDPDVIDGFLGGEITDPLPPELGVFDWPMQRDYTLDMILPAGGDLELALYDNEGLLVGAAEWATVAGDALPRKRLAVEDLPAGTYVLETSSGAFGTTYQLQAVVVGDATGDFAVDLRDYAALQNCFTGFGAPLTGPECLPADFDANGSADLSDLDVLIGGLSGPIE